MNSLFMHSCIQILFLEDNCNIIKSWK